MTNWLIHHMVKNSKETEDPAVRAAYGRLGSLTGIVVNCLLSVTKIVAGVISGSLAIVADGVNNLGDASGAIVSLITTHMAAKPVDEEHPFGHGRFEYISGLFVAILILFMAFELIKSSLTKIFHPEALDFSALVLIILLFSILIKGYMAYYNRRIGIKIDSAAMKATSIDSLSDMLSTTVVLLSTIISHFTSLQPDGYCGVFVGLFILYSGLKAAWETISPLLGKAPDPELVKQIRDIVLSQDGILGVHDLVVHNYGPGRSLVTLHAEVSAQDNIMAIHEKIDSVEHRLKRELGCETVIHMDPIDDQDILTKTLKEKAKSLLSEIDPALSLHDFHLINHKEDPQIHFDLSVPYGYSYSDEEILRLVEQQLTEKLEPSATPYRFVIELDHHAS